MINVPTVFQMRWEIKWDRFQYFCFNLFLWMLCQAASWDMRLSVWKTYFSNNFILRKEILGHSSTSFFFFYFRGEKIPPFTCKLKLTKIHCLILSMIPSPKNCHKCSLLFFLGGQGELNKFCYLTGCRKRIFSSGQLTVGRIVAFTFCTASTMKWTQLFTIYSLEIIVKCWRILPWWKPYFVWIFSQGFRKMLLSSIRWYARPNPLNFPYKDLSSGD